MLRPGVQTDETFGSEPAKRQSLRNILLEPTHDAVDQTPAVDEGKMPGSIRADNPYPHRRGIQMVAELLVTPMGRQPRGGQHA